MSCSKAHIIIIDGDKGTGRKTLCFELAVALLYSQLKTAVVASSDAPLSETFIKRQRLSSTLPSPTILSREEFAAKADNYDAVIIPEISAADELSVNAATYITLLKKNKTTITNFKKNQSYLNTMWNLKKKIAATSNRSLNWIVCENNLTGKPTEEISKDLTQISRLYGFRVAPPLNCRKPFKNNCFGISAQDKTSAEMQKNMTYEDICAKREITKLAEFIFNA